MPLSDEQLEKMYDASLKCSINLGIIGNELEKGNEKFKEHEKRIRDVEREHSYIKGKMGAVIIFLTLCGTILIQGAGWLITYLFNLKGGT